MSITRTACLLALATASWSCSGGGGDSPGDTKAPSVATTTPARDAASASRTAPVSATFDEAVDPATVTPASFTLASPGGPVAGTVAYDAPSRTASFTPGAALAPATVYTATLTGIRDPAGNAMAAPFAWSFTTVGPAAGDLDPTFGTLGIVRTDLGSGWDQAMGMAVQTDDKIVVVGATGYTWAVVRYEPDGAPDLAFGASGVVTTSLGTCGVPYARAVALQADGKIVVVGDCAGRAAAVRYLADGSLDSGFGTAGIRWLATGASPNAIAIDASGMLLVAGRTSWYASATNSSDFWVARLDADTGAVDPTFAGDGHAWVDFKPSTYTYGSALSDEAWGLAVAPNGRIVLAGEAEDSSWTRNVALASFNADGTLYRKVVTLPTSFEDSYARAVAVDASGGIVAAGVVDNWRFGIFWYSDDLASNSYARIDLKDDGYTSEDRAYALALQGDGKVVVAGRVSSSSAADFALLRYGAGGPDGAFGASGRVFTDGGSTDDRLTAVALQSDGRIVAAGTSGGDVVLLRYLP